MNTRPMVMRAQAHARPQPQPTPEMPPKPSAGHWYFAHHKALRRLPQYRGLTLIQLRVLDAVILFVNADGVAWPSMRKLAEYCPATSNGSISKALAELETRGLLRIQRGDRLNVNRYHLWAGEVRPPAGRRVRPGAITEVRPPAGPVSPMRTSNGRAREETACSQPSTPPSSSRETSRRDQRRSPAPARSNLPGEMQEALRAWKEAGLRHLAPLQAYAPRDLRDALARLRDLKCTIKNSPARFGAYLSAAIEDVPSLAEEYRTVLAVRTKRSATARQGAAMRKVSAMGPVPAAPEPEDNEDDEDGAANSGATGRPKHKPFKPYNPLRLFEDRTPYIDAWEDEELGCPGFRGGSGVGGRGRREGGLFELVG